MMAYFVSTTELILHVNQKKAGQQGNTGNWGFGQVLSFQSIRCLTDCSSQVFAITVLLPSVFQLIRAAKEGLFSDTARDITQTASPNTFRNHSRLPPTDSSDPLINAVDRTVPSRGGTTEGYELTSPPTASIHQRILLHQSQSPTTPTAGGPSIFAAL